MNIGVNRNEDVDLRYSFSAKDLELVGIKGVTFNQPIDIRIYHIEKSMVDFEILLEVKTRILLNCSNCLEDFEMILELDLIYDNDELEYTDDYDSKSNPNIIDILPFVREELITSSPDYAICNEDCKGLCPKCGINLNESNCSCLKDDQSDDQSIEK